MAWKESKAAFKKLLKASRPKLSEASLTVYSNNLFRVAKLAGLDAIPSSRAWLNKPALKTEIKKIDVKVRRHLLTSIVVALGAYGQDRTGEWGKLLAKTSADYQKLRDERKRSSVEISKWPKEGHKALKKVLAALKPRADRVLSSTDPSKTDLFELQKYLVY